MNVLDEEKDGIWREMLKEIRKTALPNLPKRMNIISFLLANFENDKCPLKLCSSISYLLKCKKRMICISGPWMMMQSIIDFVGEAKNLRGDSHDTCTVKSKSSGHSRSSTFSTSSAN
ncbi:hypothetical protein pdam_00019987 [Pocillopora damicornis]|uniref:Uncharacterized protein n=1 Tax=Pocillopora damicornis TaxID=46731 RepID=A0A3M6TW96_POCDA|nr:hypothetical protein pdam_00019987 [Pocillopora damicornis]